MKNRKNNLKCIPVCCTNNIGKNRDDPKKYWAILHGILGLNSKQNITKISTNRGTVHTNQNLERVAEEFNLHFNQVPVKLLAENHFDMNGVACEVDIEGLATLEIGE